MNKNVSVWRGSEAPPTNYHVWINEKKNNAIYLHNGSDWDPVVDPDAYETLLDYLRHKEDSPKIDVINEIPNGNDFKNGEFLLYKLGKDITISSPECYEFGKTISFTIREGDLCLIGKIKHAPTSLEAERPKFSDKYKYKIRFDANLDYYFGGTGNVGDPVLTTTTQPLTYSLIGSEDKFIIKCGNYYAFISGERLSLTNQLSNATHFVLHELESNKFELLNYNSQSLGLNAHQGLGTDGDYSDEIHWYDAGRPGNIVLFLPQESELIIKRIISTQEATTSYSGLMSKEDKAKLNSIASNANNYSLPTASSLTKGGIKIGYSQTANNRAVQLSSNRAYVNIPDATTSQAGLMSSSDKSKLDGIANTYKPKQTAVTSPTTSGNAIDFIDSISLNVNGVITATKKSVRNATTSQSGLMSSPDKEKLDNSSAYKHVFTGLSALASSGDGWYHIIDLGDTEAAIVQISTGGHSDVQLAISSGWGGDDSFSLNILNSLLKGNSNYAYVKAIRVRKQKNGDSGYLRLEAKLNRTDYTDAKYRTTIVSVLTNANHNPIVTSDTTDKKHLLLLVTTTSETLLLEINLVDLAMIVKNIVADNLATVATSGNYNDLTNKPTIPNISNCVTTDQLANVATSGSYEDLLNKPTIPEAYNDTSLREALNQKANKSELFSKNYNDLTNKPTIPAAVTESTVSNWGFTKNTGTITGITMNGVSKGTSGTVDLGTIDTVTKVTWDASSNMNNYKTAGTYEIYGERTNVSDNLPILNSSPGHSIAAKLTVVDSSLRKADGSAPTEICVTQFLMLSNRKGGDGNLYVRTYNENNSPAADWWTPWQKMQGVKEGYIFTDTAQINPDGGVQQIDGVTGLNNMVDNGIYNGIYTDDPTFASPTFIDTFTLIVINNYAVASKDSRLKRTISQLKYAVDAITNQATVKKRTKTDGDTAWSDWTDIGGGGGSQEIDVTNMVNQYGLYTLYSQGYMKDNVVYKYQQKNGELPQFDYSDVIRPFLTSKGHTSSTAITIMIKKFNSIITLDVDMCANLSLGGDNALNHYKFITSSLSAVKVSTDMEELPSTINFTFKDNVYTVKRDITWGEAIYKYENIGRLFNIGDGKQILDINDVDLKINDKLVHVWDFIEENGVYIVVHGGSD